MRAQMTTFLARSGLVASATIARAAAATASARVARVVLPLALATGLLVAAADVAGLRAASPQGREPAGQQGQEPIFRAGTRIVPVLTTVTDAQGRLVPSLEKEDFTVLDNGKPIEMTVFLNETQPFTAVVMLDTSASMTANLDRLKSAAEQFVIRLLPEDKAQVGAFSDKIQFSGTFTNDRDDLIGSLRDLQYGNPTRLYDAIDASILELEQSPGRRVVLVFTDGEDTASRRNMGDALQHAREKETMIYAIGLESEFMIAPGRVQRTRPDRGLRKLADETGGGYFELKKTDDLGPTFTRVAQELHALYTIGFTPPVMDNKEHKLEVRVKQAGMTARARKSYVASAERLTSTP